MNKTNAIVLSFALGAIGVGAAQAQIIVKPTGPIYESSQGAGNAGAQNLFDGTNLNPPSNTTTNLQSSFAAYGTTGYGDPSVLHDPNPIVAFNLGSAYTTSSVDYSQRGNGGFAPADSITSGTVYTLTLAEYTSYTSGLLVSNDSAGSNEGGAQTAPTSFIGSATFTPNGSNGNAGYQNYALSSTLSGEYFVVQFTGNSVPIYTYGGNPGGDEFEVVGTQVVPEPSTYAMLVIGLTAMGILARHRLVA